MLLYFRDMLHPLPAVSIFFQSIDIIMPELPSQNPNSHFRYVNRIFLEGADISDRCKLNSKSEPIIFFPPPANQCTIMVVQMEILGEILWRWIAVVTPIVFELIGC